MTGTRLMAVVAHEARLVRRYRVLHAAVFVTVVWAVIVLALPAGALPLSVPLLLFAEATTVGLFFIAGLALFERDEGTDHVLDVTPLGPGTRLVGRLAVLSGLTVLMAWVIAGTAVASGLSSLPHLAALTAGVWPMALVVLLVGHWTAARVAKVTDYLIAVQGPLMLLALPLLGYLGWVETPLWWLLPSHGSLVLLSGAVGQPPSAPVILAALGVQAAWVACLGALALRPIGRGAR